MIRQTLLTALTLLVASAPSTQAFAKPVTQAFAKPVTLACDLDRKIVVSLKTRSQERVKETVVFDGEQKRLTVGKRSGDYVVGKYGVATMTGLPRQEKIQFEFYKNHLETFQSDEFGMVTIQSGDCTVKSRG